MASSLPATHVGISLWSKEAKLSTKPANQPHHFGTATKNVDDTADTTEEDVNNPATFQPPAMLEKGNRVAIEFCNQCRWLHRATWTQTELFLTFPNDNEKEPGLDAVTLLPSYTAAGRWRVWLYSADKGDGHPRLVWDRKIEGGFGEMKVLKQRIRDILNPGKALGHSDKESKHGKMAETPAE